MPTIYSKCTECHDLSNLPESLWYKQYSTFIKNKKIANLLYSTILPTEICDKIVELSQEYFKCSFCKTKLCQIHMERAKHNGFYYKRINCIMCDQCCWWEVT